MEHEQMMRLALALAEEAELLCEKAKVLAESEDEAVRALAEEALRFSAKCTEF